MSLVSNSGMGGAGGFFDSRFHSHLYRLDHAPAVTIGNASYSPRGRLCKENEVRLPPPGRPTDVVLKTIA